MNLLKNITWITQRFDKVFCDTKNQGATKFLFMTTLTSNPNPNPKPNPNPRML